jgi:hypothetical protein
MYEGFFGGGEGEATVKCMWKIIIMGDSHSSNIVLVLELSLLYRVILKSMKHFKNSQQMHYAMDHGNSYADIERLSKYFSRKSPCT